MTYATHTKLYLAMRLRRLAKNAVKVSRVARVHAYTGIRAFTPLRRTLNLPSNKAAPFASAHEGTYAVRQIMPAEPYKRPLPILPGEPVPPEPLVRVQAGVCPATCVVEIKGGRFWSFYGGSAFTSDGRIIPEISKDVWGPHLHTAFTRVTLPKPVRLPGLTLSLVTPEAAANYHHWTIDCLSRVGLVQAADYKLSDFQHVLVKHRDYAFQREAFARLGLTAEQLIRVGEENHFECDTLVVPSIRHDNIAVNRADVRFVRSLYLREEPLRSIARRRLYVGRRDASFRRVTNEAEFMPLLRELGFEEVAMSRMSVAEQAKMFSEAEIVIGPNGSALANLVFANPACRVIEFFAPGWIVAYNWMICANLGLDYTVLIGNGPRPAPGELPHEVKQDIEINVDQLKKALEFSILDYRFSIGRSRANSPMERQLPIENRESKIENPK